MGDILNSWYVRAALVAGATYVAYKYAPAGAGKTIALAIGGISVAGIVAGSVPLVGQVMAGRLPLSASQPAPAI